MPSDLFGRSNLKVGGAISADATKVAFGSAGENGVTGMLMQNVNIQYRQTITRLYALETTDTYFVAGRTEGNMSVGQVIGPVAITTEFYKTYSDVCNTQKNMTMTANAGCTSNANYNNKMTLTVVGPVIEEFGLGVATSDMLINVNLKLQFVSLELS